MQALRDFGMGKSAFEEKVNIILMANRLIFILNCILIMNQCIYNLICIIIMIMI